MSQLPVRYAYALRQWASTNPSYGYEALLTECTWLSSLYAANFVNSVSSFSQPLLQFCGFLQQRRRLGLLPQILTQIVALDLAEKGIAQGVVHSAFDLDASTLQALQAKLLLLTSKNVQLQSHIDDSLLGGLAVHLENEVFDWSLKGSLQRLHKQWSNPAAVIGLGSDPQ